MAAEANPASVDLTEEFKQFHNPLNPSQAQLLQTLTALQTTCNEGFGRIWKVESNGKQFHDFMASPYLEQLMGECHGFVRTQDAKFRKRFPKSTARTTNRLKSAVENVNSLLLKLQAEDDQQLASTPSFPSSNSGNDFERKEEKNDMKGYGTGSVQRGSLKEALQELRYLERLVKPDVVNNIKKYRNNLIDLKKFRIPLENLENDELIVCAVNLSFLRSYANLSGGSTDHLLNVEKAFWGDKIKKYAKPGSLQERNLIQAITGIVYRAFEMNKQERYLLHLFVQARECVENLKSFSLLDAESFIIDGIIASYGALDKVSDPLAHLVDTQEEAKQLIKEIEDAPNVVVNACSTDALLSFEDKINELFHQIFGFQSTMNKSAIRRSRELVDSIEFCSHLLSATFMLTSPPLSPTNDNVAGDDGPNSPRGRIKLNVEQILAKANEMSKAGKVVAEVGIVVSE
eukprot:TRINITY_DN1133_c0_g1_i4.p1 TRINITY_DN1133_c0_g1~~TRINITY_DN1133_c0_g1_i4.p1  ORF type:complete len:459 (+),score=134.58 TRINITY_DN1133_c0_g1_i4:1038-2414(+)